ncbi:MAG: histidinol dehydrogenase, partial [Fimbriimonas sp.]
LREQSMAILVRDEREAADVINAIAPEHLTLSVSNSEKWLDLIENAGCILLGEQSAESAGDYAAGPSHTLPTAQAARFGSPVNVLHFLKVQSVIHLDAPLAQELAPIIETFGEIEGFPQHALGGRLRASS